MMGTFRSAPPPSPRDRRTHKHLAGLLFLALVAPACGRSGSTTTTTSTSASSPPTSPSITLTSPAGVQSGVVAIQYQLADPGGLTASMTVEVSTNGGGTFRPATGGPGGDGTSGLATSAAPGTSHVFMWDSVYDGVGLVAAAGSVQIRLIPRTAVAGAPIVTGSFTVDNTSHSAPSLTFVPISGTQSGLVSIGYFLIDADSDPCWITASFSVDGGATFAPATAGPGGDGTNILASSPGGGTSHVFLWNSVADGVALGGSNSQVRILLQPVDGQTGASTSTPNFAVNNAGSGAGSPLGQSFPVQVNSTAVSDWATATASDGVYLYTAGFEGFNLAAASGADSTWRLEKRVVATGALVASFGVGGAVSENPGPGVDLPFKVIVDGSFLFVVGAQETAQGSRVFLLRVEKRRTSDGALVPTFGSVGVLSGTIAGGLDGIPLAWTGAVDGSFLYLAGSAPVSSTDLEWRIEKHDKLTGAPVSGFGTGGTVLENPTSIVDGCFGMVIDPNYLWLVGADSLDAAAASDGRIRIEKRSIQDGTLVAAFGSGGVISVNAGPGDDIAEDVVADGTSLYVYSRVETAASSGLFSRRLEKRSLVDGTLSAGPVLSVGTDPSGAAPFHHMALDGTSLLVSAGDGPSSCAWRIEKRQTSDLTLVPTFGASGVQTINPAAGGYHRPLDLVVRGGVLVVSGMSSASGDEGWRIEAMWR